MIRDQRETVLSFKNRRVLKDILQKPRLDTHSISQKHLNIGKVVATVARDVEVIHIIHHQGNHLSAKIDTIINIIKEENHLVSLSVTLLARNHFIIIRIVEIESLLISLKIISTTSPTLQMKDLMKEILVRIIVRIILIIKSRDQTLNLKNVKKMCG